MNSLQCLTGMAHAHQKMQRQNQHNHTKPCKARGKVKRNSKKITPRLTQLSTMATSLQLVPQRLCKGIDIQVTEKKKQLTPASGFRRYSKLTATQRWEVYKKTLSPHGLLVFWNVLCHKMFRTTKESAPAFLNLRAQNEMRLSEKNK